jgi:uncharacterized protein (DUF1499 family)
MRALITIGSVLAIVAIVVVVMVGAGLYLNRVPLFDPPGPGARIGVYLSTNVAQTSSVPVLPELSPIVISANPQSALREVMRAADDLGWSEVSMDEDASQVRATVVSSLFRFRDDVRVDVSAQYAEQTEIQVRAASRVGRGDLGANAQHIMQLRDALRRRGVLAADES